MKLTFYVNLMKLIWTFFLWKYSIPISWVVLLSQKDKVECNYYIICLKSCLLWYDFENYLSRCVCLWVMSCKHCYDCIIWYISISEVCNELWAINYAITQQQDPLRATSSCAMNLWWAPLWEPDEFNYWRRDELKRFWK